MQTIKPTTHFQTKTVNWLTRQIKTIKSIAQQKSSVIFIQ